jgi:hypothetical protein
VGEMTVTVPVDNERMPEQMGQGMQHGQPANDG